MKHKPGASADSMDYRVTLPLFVIYSPTDLNCVGATVNQELIIHIIEEVVMCNNISVFSYLKY